MSNFQNAIYLLANGKIRAEIESRAKVHQTEEGGDGEGFWIVLDPSDDVRLGLELSTGIDLFSNSALATSMSLLRSRTVVTSRQPMHQASRTVRNSALPTRKQTRSRRRSTCSKPPSPANSPTPDATWPGHAPGLSLAYGVEND